MSGWRDKLIGSSTDGAPNMTGCNVGFTSLLANAVSSPAFYRVWCLAHQMDLVIKAAANAIHDVGGLSIYYHYDDGHRLASATGNSDYKNGQQVPLLNQR
jgi:hypothetical protein